MFEVREKNAENILIKQATHCKPEGCNWRDELPTEGIDLLSAEKAAHAFYMDRKG